MSYDYEIHVRVEPNYDIVATDAAEIEMELDSGFIYPQFPGPYEITPAVTDQVLSTQYKTMTDDLTVLAITPNYGDASSYITTKNGAIVLLQGWYTGGEIRIAPTEAAKIKSANILAEITVLGITGDPNNVNTELPADAAEAEDIAYGKKAYANGAMVTGTRYIPLVAQNGNELSIWCAETLLEPAEEVLE